LVFFLVVPLTAHADFGEVNDGYQDYFWTIDPLFVDGTVSFRYGGESNIGPLAGPVCPNPDFVWTFYVVSQPNYSTVIAAWDPTVTFLFGTEIRFGDTRARDATADYVWDSDGDFATGPLGYATIGWLGGRPRSQNILITVSGVIIYDGGSGCFNTPPDVITIQRTVTS